MQGRNERRKLFLARVTATGLLLGALLLAVALCPLGKGVAYADSVVTATVRPNPLSVTVSSAPRTVVVGHRFQIKAKIENLGAGQVSGVVATIQFSDDGLTLLSDTDAQYLGTIRKQRTARWRLQADGEGSYVVQVSVTGRDEAGQLIAKEGSTLVEVTEAPGHWGSQFWPLAWMLGLVGR